MNQQTSQDDWNSFWQNSPQENSEVSWSKRRIIKILSRYVKEDFMALDAGCGSGFFSRWFLDAGCKTVALDYSETALEAAKKATDKKCMAYIRDDLTDVAMTKRTGAKFDIIFSDGLFEHFEAEQQDAILTNMKGLLKENGVIISFVPNLITPWTLIRPFLMPSIQEKPFTPSKLAELYKRNSIEVVEAGGVNFVPHSLSPESLAGSFGMLLYSIGKTADSSSKA